MSGLFVNFIKSITMKNLKKIKRQDLKNVMGGASPDQGCLPCDVYCSIPEGQRPPCKIVYIVAHCNSCKGYGEES
jgi:hypothetical protein